MKDSKKQNPKRVIIAISIIIAVAAAGTFGYISLKKAPKKSEPATQVQKSETPETSDIKVVEGRWIRPDGGYVLELRNVKSDGSVEAAYFNPSQIHVDKSQVTLMKGAVLVFVVLNDENYPNCKYTLAYDPTQDVLYGVYEQTMMGQSYQIYFERDKGK